MFYFVIALIALIIAAWKETEGRNTIIGLFVTIGMLILIGLVLSIFD